MTMWQTTRIYSYALEIYASVRNWTSYRNWCKDNHWLTRIRWSGFRFPYSVRLSYGLGNVRSYDLNFCTPFHKLRTRASCHEPQLHGWLIADILHIRCHKNCIEKVWRKIRIVYTVRKNFVHDLLIVLCLSRLHCASYRIARVRMRLSYPNVNNPHHKLYRTTYDYSW